ncbi:hypothetical protein D3C76_1814950 [compost metagenome]
MGTVPTAPMGLTTMFEGKKNTAKAVNLSRRPTWPAVPGVPSRSRTSMSRSAGKVRIFFIRFM